jgi:hypothetical protein
MNLTRPNTSSSSARPYIPITPTVLLVCFLVCQFTPSRVAAGVVIDIEQTGGNVVANLSGTLDTSGLTFVGGATSGGDLINPDIAAITIAAPGGTALDYYRGFTGPATWGSGSSALNTSTTTGNPLGIYGNTSIYGNAALFLPRGYISGATLSATATWDGQTFSTLGLNPGTYVYTWGSGPTADSLTVDVVSSQAVPEPATLWIALIGGVAIFAHSRIGRRKTRNR